MLARGGSESVASRGRGRGRAGGFTLIELLVVISIIALLIGILLPALSRARDAARAVEGRSSVRQVQIGYIGYADDHRGYLMPGYDTEARAKNRDGEEFRSPAAHRYPWRLIPYLDWDWDVFYYDRPVPEDEYVRSVYPSFGLNSWFLGGDDSQYGSSRTALQQWGPFFARRIEDVRRADHLLVFADAFSTEGTFRTEGSLRNGYFRVTAPYFAIREWNLDEPEVAKNVGYVDERFDGRATVTFLDGHAEALTHEELDDMTRWAPLARSKDYVVSDRLGD